MIYANFCNRFPLRTALTVYTAFYANEVVLRTFFNQYFTFCICDIYCLSLYLAVHCFSGRACR